MKVLRPSAFTASWARSLRTGQISPLQFQLPPSLQERGRCCSPGLRARAMADRRNDKGKDDRPRNKFPLGPPPVLPPMPFNPFVNHSVPLSDPWECVTAVLMLPLVLCRMSIFVGSFFCAYIVANIALIGARNVFTKPFPKWRRNLLWPVSLCVRAVLFACGYNWIKIKGRPAKREVAPILVCNHVTSIDPLYLFMAHLPMIVTAKENLHIPVAGVVMKALQVVTVDRSSSSSRRDAAGEIKRRAMCNDWPHVALFPEATTTNGRSLVSFKTGAFVPGLPVQPVVVRYPYTNFDPSWVADGMPTLTLIFRMMCCLNNQMIVEYLPPIFPTLAEEKDARLFAERCRVAMAKALNVNTTEHAFGDVALALEAQKLKLPTGTTNLEYGRFEQLYHLDLQEAKAYLRRFNQLDVHRRGLVSYQDFVEGMNLPDSDLARMVFDLFDTNQHGIINFREYVAGLLFLNRHPQFEESVRSLLATLDADRDGRLSAEDARARIPKIFPTMSPGQHDKVYRSMGLDKQDFLSRDDFSSFLRAQPEYLALALAAQVCKS